MNFRNTSEEGGCHFRSEKFCCVFSVILGGKNAEFFGKRGGVTPIQMNFVANFRASQKKAQAQVWEFSEKSSNLVQIVTPYETIETALSAAFESHPLQIAGVLQCVKIFHTAWSANC